MQTPARVGIIFADEDWTLALRFTKHWAAAERTGSVVLIGAPRDEDEDWRPYRAEDLTSLDVLLPLFSPDVVSHTTLMAYIQVAYRWTYSEDAPYNIALAIFPILLRQVDVSPYKSTLGKLWWFPKDASRRAIDTRSNIDNVMYDIVIEILEYIRESQRKG